MDRLGTLATLPDPRLDPLPSGLSPFSYTFPGPHLYSNFRDFLSVLGSDEVTQGYPHCSDVSTGPGLPRSGTRNIPEPQSGTHTSPRSLSCTCTLVRPMTTSPVPVLRRPPVTRYPPVLIHRSSPSSPYRSYAPRVKYVGSPPERTPVCPVSVPSRQGVGGGRRTTPRNHLSRGWRGRRVEGRATPKVIHLDRPRVDPTRKERHRGSWDPGRGVYVSVPSLFKRHL